MKDMIVGNFDADIADVQAGTYVVTIKSYRTEQVVCKKEVTFSSGPPIIDAVEINFSKQLPKNLESIEISLKNNGDIPLQIKGGIFEERDIKHECSIRGIILPKETLVVKMIRVRSRVALRFSEKSGGS